MMTTRITFNQARINRAVSEIFTRIDKGDNKKAAMREVLSLHDFDVELARKVVEAVEIKLRELGRVEEKQKQYAHPVKHLTFR
jgi:hypothetical protein